MQVEHRTDDKRINISRPVEIVNPEFGENIQGYIKNLSVGGMRARLDSALKTGDFVTLEIALAHDAEPVETEGEVIWCEPDASGYGAEVGLKFLKDDETRDKSGRQIEDPWKSEMDLLKPGRKVSIEADGRSLPAVVEELTRSDEGGSPLVRVSLIPDDSAAAGSHELDDTALEYESHRFGDFKDWCLERLRSGARHARPLGATSMRVLKSISQSIKRWF